MEQTPTDKLPRLVAQYLGLICNTCWWWKVHPGGSVQSPKCPKCQHPTLTSIKFDPEDGPEASSYFLQATRNSNRSKPPWI